MRVIEVITDTNIGGAGVLLCNRLRYAKEGIETIVFLPRGSKLTKRLRAEGIKTVPLRKCADRSFDITAIPELCFKLSVLRPDLVNTHASLTARAAVRLSCDAVSVYTRHCTYRLPSVYKLAFARSVMRKITDILSDGVIAVSPKVKLDLMEMGVRGEQVSVIVNGAEELRLLSRKEMAELRRALGIPLHARVVSIFARLEPCKDHATFLRAARIIANTSDEYYFLIVGTGSIDKEMKDLCQRLGIAERVVFTGFVEDVSPYMSITDINVNCSVGSETSSLSLSEGMSLGIPSVVSDFGGNGYMVRDGVNGLVYPQGDHRRLAEAIFRISEKELYAKCSEKSLERFENELNAKRMAEKTYALYEYLKKEKDKENG